MATAPFREEHSLNHQLSLDVSAAVSTLHGPSLPGQARIALHPRAGLDSYLVEEHLTPDLDRLAPRLWLVRLVRHAR